MPCRLRTQLVRPHISFVIIPWWHMTREGIADCPFLHSMNDGTYDTSMRAHTSSARPLLQPAAPTIHSAANACERCLLPPSDMTHGILLEHIMLEHCRIGCPASRSPRSKLQDLQSALSCSPNAQSLVNHPLHSISHCIGLQCTHDSAPNSANTPHN